MKSLFLIKEEIVKHKDATFLTVLIFIFSLLRIPSLVEPYWYGDEGIYQVIGMAMRQGRLLYKEIWDNKPPLLYILYALFNGEQFYVRLLSLVFGVLAVVVLFYFAKRLFLEDQGVEIKERRKTVYVSTAVFVLLFGLPILEGNIANAENFMHLPILLAFFLSLYSKRKRNLVSLLSGLLLGAAFLIKIVAVFDFAALLLIRFVFRYFDQVFVKEESASVLVKNLERVILFVREESLFIVSFLAPIGISIGYFLVKGAFFDYMRAAFSQNVGYVGYGNYFLFPQGLLSLKLLLLFFSLALIIGYRKKIGRVEVLIYIWLAFSLFNAFFSARPYTHYLLVLLPSFSLLFGRLVATNAFSFQTLAFFRKQAFSLNLLLVFLVFFLVVGNFYFYGRILSYYKNFLDFVMDNRKVERYQAFFDKNTVRDYDVARFIETRTTSADRIFIWSDSGQIYALSNKLPPGRYIVSYHITFYKDAIDETRNALLKRMPKYIIDTKHTPSLAAFLTPYTLKYKIQDARIYERQF